MSLNDNQVRVEIVGDASRVAPAINLAKGSIAGLETAVAQMSATMTALTERMEAGFAVIASGSAEAFGGMGLAAKAGAVKVAESANVVTLASEKIVAAGEMAKTKWEAVGMGFSKLNGIMLGITAALAGGVIFKETIAATTKLTQENLQLSRALGVTLEKASGVHSAMNKLGIGVDQVTGASQKMVRQLKAHEDQFNKVGIATRDANGHFRDTLDILTSGLGRLGEYRAGVDRTAVAQMMFGRGAGDLTTMMRLNNAEIEEGARVAKELGLVTTSEGVTAMRRYKDSVREVHEVMEGFKVQIGQAMLPLLTRLSEWFREHGASAIKHFTGFLTGLINGIERLYISFHLLQAVVDLFATNFAASEENISSVAEQMMQLFRTVKAVIIDAFTLNWGAIQADWAAGMAKIDEIATSHARHIASEIGAAKSAVDNLKTAFWNVGKINADQDKGTPTSLSGIMAAGHQADETGGLREDDITGKKGAKEKKPKGAKDDLMQKLNDELEAMKTGWEQKQLLQGTAQAFSLESEAAFWDKAKARTNLSAKDKLEIEKKWVAAHQAIQKQDIEKQIELFKAEMDAAGKNWTAKRAVLEQEAAFKTKMYGAESKEARQAAEAVLQAQRQETEQLRRLADDLAKHKRSLALLDVDDAQAAAQARVAMGRETAGQLIQQEKAFEAARFALRRDELEAEKALIDQGRDPEAYRKASEAIETLERQHQNVMTEIDRKAVEDRTKIERGAIDSIAASWGSAMSKMITLQASFASTIKNMWQGIQQAIGGAIQGVLTKFIAAELMKLLHVKATGAATVGTEAAKAGAGGTASMAAAPFPLNLGAPAFGASMSAIAGSFGALNMAEGGDWNVTEGLYGLHKNEMVLPAWAAQPLRDMISGNRPAANFNSPAATNDGGGDVHVHLHGAIIQNPGQLKQFFKDNHQAVGAGVRQFVRQGGNTGTMR